MDERSYSTFKSKIGGTQQEVIFPDFPDDDNTTTTTVTKSRRVSFGSNFIKEFIVGSAVSAQCVSEYEQAFSSSDSSNANSSHSAVESSILNQSHCVLEENQKMNHSIPVNVEENHIKHPKISSTICFSADSPTDDMEFTEGCISLAKHILDKKNKEMTVIIQAKPKESKEEVKPIKDDETHFFDGSNFDMSMTKCFKSKNNNSKIEKKFQGEKTRIFNQLDDEMSITTCNKVLSVQESNILSDDENESWGKDKRNKEYTVRIQAKPKDSKEEVKPIKDDETQFFDGSNFDMSMTKCFKSKNNKKIEKKFQAEKTRIFNQLDVEMSITTCNKVLSVQESNIFSDDESESWIKDDCKESQMPLDMIMQHLDKDSSDIDEFLFNPEKTLNDVLKANLFETLNESEKLNLNESMDISKDFQPNFSKNHHLVSSDIKNYEGKNKLFELNNLKEDSNEISQKENSDENNISKEEDSFLEAITSGANLVEQKEAQEEMEISFAKDQEPNSDVTFSNPVEMTEELGIPGKNGHFINGEEDMDETTPVNLCDDLENVEDVTQANFMRAERTAEELPEEGLKCTERIEESLTQNRSISLDKDEQNVALDMCVFRKKEETGDKSEEKLEKSSPKESVTDEKIEGSCLEGGEIAKEDENHKEMDCSTDELIINKKESLIHEGLEKMEESVEKIVRHGEKEEERLGDEGHQKMEESVEKIVCHGGKKEESLDDEGHEKMEVDAPQVDDKVEAMSLTYTKREQNDSVKSLPQDLGDDNVVEHHNTKNIQLDMSLTKVKNHHLEFLDSNDQPETENPEETNFGVSGTEEGLEVKDKSQQVFPSKSIISSESLEVADDGVDMSKKPKCDSPALPEQNEKVNDVQPNQSLMDKKVVDDQPNPSLTDEKMNDDQPNQSLLDKEVIDDQPNPSLMDKEVIDDQPNPSLMDKKVNNDQPNPSLMDEEVNDDQPNQSLLDKEVIDDQPNPSLMDKKVIENLKEQSKEPGCIWKFEDLQYPTKQSLGFLKFNFELLESSMTVKFSMKSSEEDTIIACCSVLASEMLLVEEKALKLPEYKLVVHFGFEKLKKNFQEENKSVKTIRHVPYFLDQMNIFTLKINACLQQVLSILTLYPGSRLSGSTLSFRLFSFPVFFSCTVSIDLTNLYRLSSSSLSFDVDLGSFDVNKFRDIFEKCLECDNCLCEFVVRSTKYIVGLERKTGRVTKREHIRLLPADCH